MEIKHFGIFLSIISVLLSCMALVGVEAVDSTDTTNNNYVSSNFKMKKPKWEPGIGSATTSYSSYNGKIVNPNRNQNRRRRRHKQKEAEESTRTFSIPSGTVLKITPEITIPISKSDDERFTCKTEFGASFPISITFKETNWKKMAQEFFVLDPFRRGTNFWNPYGFDEGHNVIHDSVQAHHRKSRDLSFLQLINETSASASAIASDVNFSPAKVSRGRCPVKSLMDGKSILEEVEIAGFRMFGVDSNPRACLLRAICEMHEEPIYHELGLLGEAVTVTFSFEEISRDCEDDQGQFPLLTYLRPYIDAEVAGKSGKCQDYHKKCPKSIFTYV